ncbi:MAG: GNAT family N-acetyltransferase [Ruminococcaceae bacterium]|nr:GNAT family N-acetyltransferase [Oscillospiraceae bacterium]
MLYLADSLRKLDFRKLMTVYEEGNRENGAFFWPELSEGQQLHRAEEDFYQYLQEVFFPVKGAVYAIWQEDGVYKSALRLEPYDDGLLLEGLETAPDHRRRGHAEKLIRAVLEAYPQRIYSHVSKKNVPSLSIHKKCGFTQVLDYAKEIDGSFLRSAVTFRYR